MLLINYIDIITYKEHNYRKVMNYDIILSNTRALLHAYQSDPKHKSPEALRAKDQMKQLTVTERKLLVKIIENIIKDRAQTLSDDDPKIEYLAKRIVAIQNPNYQSFRTKTKLASFSRGLKNLWKRPSTEYVFKEAGKLPPAPVDSISSKGSPPPDDLPPIYPPELLGKEIVDGLNQLATDRRNRAKNPFATTDEHTKGKLIPYVQKIIDLYQSTPNKKDETLINSAIMLNTELKELKTINKEDFFNEMRTLPNANEEALNFLESQWDKE